MDIISRLQAAMPGEGVAATVITPGADLRYVAGYDAKPLERLTALVVPVTGPAFMVAPELEGHEARSSAFGAAGGEVITWGETEDPFAIIATRISGLPAGSVAVDDHMWAERVLRLRSVLPERGQVVAGGLLRSMRLVKTAAEIEYLQEAASAIDAVHAQVPSIMRAGMTEAQAGALIADAILKAGHVQVDFVIVGSGPNGASPHHSVSDRVMQVGDPVVVDIGGTMPSGYCSDCTRTYVLGEPSADYQAAYDILLDAQQQASAFVAPGRTCEAIDSKAREVMATSSFDGAPLSDYFIHRIGHGIGLESHEEPYLVQGNDLALSPGMTFSVEPGFYISGKFGARIEDIVVCTADGVHSLNKQPRELIRIPA
ncbi:MAG: M24 family metallopeptidase [Candidatus Nanopelagicales bacterium]